MTLEAHQLAALQGVARLGARAAADALRVLLGGRTVELTHTDAAALPDLVSRMGGPAASATAIVFRVSGELAGSVLVALPGTSATELAALLLGRPVTELGVEAQSAVEEAGNILASTYLTQVGRATHLELLPSVPHLIRGRMDALLDLPLEIIGATPDQVVGIEAGLRSRPEGPTLILGHFLPGDGPAALPRLLASIR